MYIIIFAPAGLRDEQPQQPFLEIKEAAAHSTFGHRRLDAHFLVANAGFFACTRARCLREPAELSSLGNKLTMGTRKSEQLVKSGNRVIGLTFKLILSVNIFYF